MCQLITHLVTTEQYEELKKIMNTYKLSLDNVETIMKIDKNT